MSNDTGKWTPYNLDNTAHECKNRDKSPTTQTPQTKQVQEQQSETGKTVWAILEEFNKRLIKLESKLYSAKKDLTKNWASMILHFSNVKNVILDSF